MDNVSFVASFYEILMFMRRCDAKFDYDGGKPGFYLSDGNNSFYLTSTCYTDLCDFVNKLAHSL